MQIVVIIDEVTSESISVSLTEARTEKFGRELYEKWLNNNPQNVNGTFQIFFERFQVDVACVSDNTRDGIVLLQAKYDVSRE